MAAKAFILIETTVGTNKAVVRALQQLAEVKSVDTVTGPYDVIVLVEVATQNDIGELLIAKIQPIAGIVRSVTCLVM